MERRRDGLFGDRDLTSRLSLSRHPAEHTAGWLDGLTELTPNMPRSPPLAALPQSLSVLASAAAWMDGWAAGTQRQA